MKSVKSILGIVPVILLLLTPAYLPGQDVDLKEAQQKEKERMEKLKKEGKTTDWEVTDEELRRYEAERNTRDRLINRGQPQPVQKKVEQLRKFPAKISRSRMAAELRRLARRMDPSPGILAAALLISLFYLAVMWRVFAKAGQPGIAALVPLYNIYVMIRIAGRSGWWFLLLFIPVINVIVGIILNLDIAANFGRGILFALGLIFLGFIFWPVLAFGSSRYQPAGPAR